MIQQFFSVLGQYGLAVVAINVLLNQIGLPVPVVPTLMVAGDRDAEVPVTQSYEYWHALRDLGVPTQLVIYPGEGHLFYKPADQQDVARRVTGWFDRYLSGR